MGGCAQTPEKADQQANALSSNAYPDWVIDHEKAAKLYVELAMAYLKDGQKERSKIKLNRAMKLAPQLPEVHYALGYYLELVGEFDKAKKSYKKALNINPKGGIEHNNFGAFLCRQGLFKESEKEFLIAINDPQYTQVAEALENAGLCVMQTHDLDKAERYFEKALLRDSKRPNALLEMSYIKYQGGDIISAKKYYDRYVKIAHPIPRSLWLGIKIAQSENDKNKLSSYKLLLKANFPHSQEYKEILSNK